VVLDVHHTARTTLATGIQRVVRQILQNWQGPATLVGWNPDMRSLRSLSAAERDNANVGWPASAPSDLRPRCRPVAQPVRPPRARCAKTREPPGLAALAAFSGNGTR
jgi:hypothetical protein